MTQKEKTKGRRKRKGKSVEVRRVRVMEKTNPILLISLSHAHAPCWLRTEEGDSMEESSQEKADERGRGGAVRR